jgi:hypothetical protein
LPESQLGLLPFVEVLQHEGAGVEEVRAKIVIAGILAHDSQRPVDAVKRGGMVAPDGRPDLLYFRPARSRPARPDQQQSQLADRDGELMPDRQ